MGVFSSPHQCYVTWQSHLLCVKRRLFGRGGGGGGPRGKESGQSSPSSGPVRSPPLHPTSPALQATTTTRRRRRWRWWRRRINKRSQQGSNGNVVRALTRIPGYFHPIPSFRLPWPPPPPPFLALICIPRGTSSALRLVVEHSGEY